MCEGGDTIRQMKFQLKLLEVTVLSLVDLGIATFLMSGICGRAEPLQSGQVGATEGLLLWRRNREEKNTLYTNALHTHARSQTSYMRHRSGNGSNPTSNSLSSRLVDRGKQTDPRHSEWGFTN